MPGDCEQFVRIFKRETLLKLSQLDRIGDQGVAVHKEESLLHELALVHITTEIFA